MRSCSLVDAVADLGEEHRGPPFFLDQTEAWRAEKKIVFETAFPTPPSYLMVWMKVKVWMRHRAQQIQGCKLTPRVIYIYTELVL